MNRPAFVVFLLVQHVPNHPRNIFGSIRHDPVATLPLKRLWLDLVVNVIGAGAFQLSDPFRHVNTRFEAMWTCVSMPPMA